MVSCAEIKATLSLGQCGQIDGKIVGGCVLWIKGRTPELTPADD
jgi:hypothetical protein